MSAAPLPLRDIHLPAEPNWWPPAPGWWVLGLCALVLMLLMVKWVLREWRRRRQRNWRLREFERCIAVAGNDVQRVAAASEYLRRLCKHYRLSALTLQGDAWLNFLDQGMTQRPFTGGLGQLLLLGPFQREVASAEVDALLQAIHQRLNGDWTC